MIYKFLLEYTPTDGSESVSRLCNPLWGDSVSMSIDREDNEWYYKRRLDGKLTFKREDYLWIMSQPFDGTFTLTIQKSDDNGTSWQKYFEGTFSRANLDIDEDNLNASLSSFIEGVYNAIENGKNEEYDLMKIIPDGDAVEVQGQIPPALALVDYRGSITAGSNVFCGTPIVSAGYKSNKTPPDWVDFSIITNDSSWTLMGIWSEAEITQTDGTKILCSGALHYIDGYYNNPDYDIVNWHYKTISGTMYDTNGTPYTLLVSDVQPWVVSNNLVGLTFTFNIIYQLFDTTFTISIGGGGQTVLSYSPLSMVLSGERVRAFRCVFHYIRATLLTQSGGNADNVLDTGPYYKRMAAFDNTDRGLQIYISSRTVDQPNGYRLVPGTGEQGTIPQYFAPPTDNPEIEYIPLAENSWNYGSMWYTITPSPENGLLDESKYGSWRWTRCWTIGTVLRYLLEKITNGKVTFDENIYGSQFLYSNINPVNGNEPFDYLVTQKSNVMNPGGGSATRCIVRLNWILKLLRNAFNCYYWLEPIPNGRYSFRVEHIEYFRRGGRYDGTLDNPITLPELRPCRNFRTYYGGQLAKSYADKTNHYSYDMKNMVEKYTFSWQGDGGSDDFKGNPMFFKAGWVEPSTSEDYQVDNIFVDLNWLMINTGTSVDSSNNYEGLFLFSGYRPIAATHIENAPLTSQTMLLADLSRMVYVAVDLWLTGPEGMQISLMRQWYQPQPGIETVTTYTCTGEKQCISIVYESAFIVPNSLGLVFGSNYSQVTIHRIHARTGYVYNVPNTPDLLSPSNYLQNGPLAWPWLQNEYLHYDIPAQKWSFDSDDLDDINARNAWHDNGTVKMVQKQVVSIFPMPLKSTEDAIIGITGIRTNIEGGKTGIITNAKVNLSSRNAELTLIYDPLSPNNQ